MKSYIFTALVMVLFVLALFPVKLNKELTLEQHWSVHWDDSKVSVGDVPIIPFVAEGKVGAITREGQLIHMEKVYFGATVGDEYFFNYSQIPSLLLLKNWNGEVVQTYNYQGYPFILDHNIFFIDTNGKTLSHWTGDGDPDWSRTFSSILSDVDAAHDLIITGSISGEVSILDYAGRILSMKRYEDSAPVLACRISPFSDMAATIHGGERPVLRLYNLRSGSLRKLREYSLPVFLNRNVQLSFISADQLAAEYDTGYLLVNLVDLSVEFFESSRVMQFDSFLNKGLFHTVMVDHGRAFFESRFTSGEVLSRHMLYGVSPLVRMEENDFVFLRSDGFVNLRYVEK